MTDNPVNARIILTLKDYAADPHRLIGDADNLFDDLGLDSVDLMEATIALEEEFDIEISDDEIERAQTAGDILTMVHHKLAQCA